MFERALNDCIIETESKLQKRKLVELLNEYLEDDMEEKKLEDVKERIE